MTEQPTNGSTHPSSRPESQKQLQGITAITVKGYKSIRDETTISIAPLTILAGANSSGKSSIIQPLLLMKQTLEASYDPGTLLLNGPNLKFTATDQLFFKSTSKQKERCFEIGIEINDEAQLSCVFKANPKKLDLISMAHRTKDANTEISPDMSHEELLSSLPIPIQNIFSDIILIEKVSAKETTQTDLLNIMSVLKERIDHQIPTDMMLKVIQSRCFFEIHSPALSFPLSSSLTAPFEEHIQDIIHVPGLRGNPERTYKATAFGHKFPGTFENYVAGIINHWQVTKDKKLNKLADFLQVLGLTSKIESREIDDTQVELVVGRLPCGSNQKITKKDMVSIADVGFGVSQTLPVLVALLVANPGQLVYVEQPEIHLHPRAQVALAEVFADAIRRGVRVIVETHSELFLLGIQSLVAEGTLPSSQVMLHWFTRKEDGSTNISSSPLDEVGAFGDWPEDFGEVSLGIQNRYLTAAEAKLWANGTVDGKN